MIKNSRLFLFVCMVIALFQTKNAFAQMPAGANGDESKIPPYTLPDPLIMQTGKKVTSPEQWTKVQRPYIYRLFEENVYGRYPRQQVTPRFKIRESSNHALGGTAIRKQVRIYLHPADSTVFIDLLLYLPAKANKAVPVFVGLNFGGNQSIQSDTAIFLTESWVPPGNGVSKPLDSTRGKDQGWPVKEILEHGYAVATAYCADIEPDHKDGWKTGIRTTLKDVLKIKPEEWSAMGAWAWGLSRMLDYLQQDKSVDAGKIAVMGHSRLGKACLWAGASDPRFSMVISNESGEGGAALSKRFYGETIKNLNDHFPHWFVSTYTKYNDNAGALPVDQHMLLSLIAPRPLYVASAIGDQWSDPKGEFLSAVNAAPVYALFGKKGLGTDIMPPVNHPIGNTIRYHIREGNHAINLYDWQQYLGFADSLWK